MRWDDDLVDNSMGAVETLVCLSIETSIAHSLTFYLQIRVGMSVGHTPDHPPHTHDMKKANPTMEEKQEAKRRISGSLAPERTLAGMGAADIK